MEKGFAAPIGAVVEIAMSISAFKFGWHAKSYDTRMASIRLRLLQPVDYLRAEGVDVGPYCATIGPHGYDAIIFSKSFCGEALKIAHAAKAARRIVILDLCDNIFEGKVSRKKAKKAAGLKEMLGLADHVVFSTQTLAEQIQAVAPEIALRSHVIPDAVETVASGDGAALSIGDRLALTGLKRFLSRHNDALHCVWFGKSQGNMAGFVHLDAAVKELEIFASRHPVTLTIISNKRLKYWQAMRGWRVPCHYMSWSLGSINQALALHHVAVVPLRKNKYTAGKTINRPATAIAAGLGVIADSIESYEELRPFIMLDDWQGGLERYRACKPQQDDALIAAREHLETRYGRLPVGRKWHGLLEEVMARHRAGSDL